MTETIHRLHCQSTSFLWLQVIIMITMTSNLKLKRKAVYLTLAVAQTFEEKTRLTEGEWILVAFNDYWNIKDTEFETTV